jgi:hypothetical protein
MDSTQSSNVKHNPAIMVAIMSTCQFPSPHIATKGRALPYLQRTLANGDNNLAYVGVIVSLDDDNVRQILDETGSKLSPQPLQAVCHWRRCIKVRPRTTIHNFDDASRKRFLEHGGSLAHVP